MKFKVVFCNLKSQPSISGYCPWYQSAETYPVIFLSARWQKPIDRTKFLGPVLFVYCPLKETERERQRKKVGVDNPSSNGRHLPFFHSLFCKVIFIFLKPITTTNLWLYISWVILPLLLPLFFFSTLDIIFSFGLYSYKLKRNNVEVHVNVSFN